MKRLRRLTVVEWLTILFIVAVLGGLLLPDSATTTRWHLEKRARDFASADIARLSDESILATDPDIAGTWTCRHRLDGSVFTFSRRDDGQFDVDFSTRGCLGRCDLRRTAKIDKGVIRLDAAVAEYLTRTYNTLLICCRVAPGREPGASERHPARRGERQATVATSTSLPARSPGLPHARIG